MKTSQTASAKKALAPGLMIALLLIVAVAAPLNMNKVPPLASALMRQFRIGESQFGMLVSVFSLAGLLLALPGGWIIEKLGTWKCMLLGVTALLAGSLLGDVSPDFTLLLASRTMEGVGMAVISVAGPAIVGQQVSSKRRGAAMGFFSAYIGIGQVLSYNLAPRLTRFSGWHGAWRFTSLYTAVALVLWLFVMIKMHAFGRKASGGLPEGAARKGALFTVMKSGSLWCLSLSFCLYTASFASIQIYLPNFFEAARGMSAAGAASLVSLCCLAGTVSSVFAGMISDKVHSRLVLGGACLIASGGLFLLIPAVPASLITPFLILLGILPPILPVCALAAASETFRDPKTAGAAMGLMMLGQYVGFVAGPLLFGSVVQLWGWPAAFAVSAPLAVVGGAAILWVKRLAPKRF